MSGKRERGRKGVRKKVCVRERGEEGKREGERQRVLEEKER